MEKKLVSMIGSEPLVPAAGQATPDTDEDAVSESDAMVTTEQPTVLFRNSYYTPRHTHNPNQHRGTEHRPQRKPPTATADNLTKKST